MNHFKNIDKIRPETLLSMFYQELNNSSDFRFLGGVQPFLISYKSRNFFIYIKNISSAYFSDRDRTTRAQLPIKSEFNKIKESEFPFVFLGYDGINDVYVCWNYHVVKKRLNEGKSVSFYSRSFFQTEVKETGFLRKELKNGDTPVLFKRKNIIEFFDKIDTFFDEVIEFEIPFSHNSNKDKFVLFLKKEKKLSQKSIQNYVQALDGRIKLLIQSYLISSFTSIFKIIKIDDLMEIKHRLFEVSAFIDLNNKGKKMYSCALNNYILYANHLANNTSVKLTPVIKHGVKVKKVGEKSKNLKLTKITDPDLLNRIKPHIFSNRLLSAAQIVGQFYQNDYPKMTLSDWLTILKDIKY